MFRRTVILGMACAACAAADAADISKMNGSIRIDRGEQAGDLSTLNGEITVGDDATAADVSTVNGEIRIGDRATVGHIEAVNGEITLGAGAAAHHIETVNGEIELRQNSRVSGSVTAVNGAIDLAQAAQVDGTVENVNGLIAIEGATVAGRIKTVVGDIDIGRGSRIVGGLLVEAPKSSSRKQHDLPRIVIGPDATIEGPLVFEHEVELYVSERATVGPIEGAIARRFDGPQP